MERGTWNLELGTWNLEPGIWNLELGIWNLKNALILHHLEGKKMSLISRATNILKSPKTEWDVIAGESANTTGLITGYAVPLSLLSHIAGFIGSAFASATIGTLVGVHFGMPFWIGTAVLGFIFAMVGLYLAAFAVNALAPTFGSVKNSVNAMKLVVYAYTGLWVGGLLSVVPMLGGLGTLVGGCYSIYLFYIGIPKLMGTPQEKVVSYMLVSALVMVVLYMVIASIVGTIAVAFFATTAATIINMN